MSEHAWTPGPWRAERLKGQWSSIFSGSNYVAQVTGDANARLIAAAPKLAEAARRVLDGLHERIDTADPRAVPVFDGIAELAAALAKAEGPRP